MLITKGDILNVVGGAAATVVTATNNIGNSAALAGTSFSDPGCIIRGTDASGNPLQATLRYSSGASLSMIGVRENQRYIDIMGFKIDRPGSAQVNNDVTFINILQGVGNNTAGPVRVRYCHDRSTTNRSGRFVRDSAGNLNDQQLLVQYNLIEDPSTNGGVSIQSDPGRRFDFDHNVIMTLTVTSTSPIVNLGILDTSVAVNHLVVNNTWVCRANSMNCIGSTAPLGASGAALKTVHSNVFAKFTGGGSDQFLNGNAAWEDIPWSGNARVIGGNVFTATVAFSWTAGGPYIVPWDEDNSDLTPGADTGQLWATDTLGAVDPFNAKDTPYSWNPNQSGYTLVLPGDYRLLQFRTAGLGGVIPGALTAITPPTAVADSYSINNAAPFNQSAPGVLVNDTDPDAGDTLFAILVTNIAPVSAGSVVLNSNGSFVYTPTAGFVGTCSFTYKARDDSGLESPPVTVTISVVNAPAAVLGSQSLLGASTPGKLLPNASLQLTRNTAETRVLQEYRPDAIATPAAYPARTSVPALTVDGALQLGSIAAFSALILQPDRTITVKVNSGPGILIKAGGCMLLANANGLTTVKLSNPHPTAAASVDYMVVQ